MGEDNGDTGNPLRRRLWTALKLLCTGVILFLVARHIRGQWSQLTGHDWSLDLTMLGLAFPLSFAALVYSGVVWALQVSSAGVDAPPTRVAAGSLLSRLGKYLPGKVWAVLGRGYFLSREGTEMSSALGLSILAQGVVIVAGAIWALPFITVIAGHRVWLLAVLGAIPPLGLASLHPRVIEVVSGPFFRLMGRPPLRIDLSFRGVLYWVFLTLTRRVPTGLAFCAFAATFAGVGWADVPLLIGTLSAAGVIGLLAVFAPGGLGVREGMLMIALPTVMGAEEAIAVAVGWRLWMTVIELLCAGAAWGWLRWGGALTEDVPSAELDTTCPAD